MANLAQSVETAELRVSKMQIDASSRTIKYVPQFEAAALKHGRKCKCEACSALHMQRTRDKRMKAMMPGNVDMGNRQPATMGKGRKSKVKALSEPAQNTNYIKKIEKASKVKADSALHMKVKAKLDYGKPKPKVKQVPPPKQKVQSIKPSQLMHEKGKILK